MGVCLSAQDISYALNDEVTRKFVQVGDNLVGESHFTVKSFS